MFIKYLYNLDKVLLYAYLRVFKAILAMVSYLYTNVITSVIRNIYICYLHNASI